MCQAYAAGRSGFTMILLLQFLHLIFCLMHDLVTYVLSLGFYYYCFPNTFILEGGLGRKNGSFVHKRRRSAQQSPWYAMHVVCLHPLPCLSTILYHCSQFQLMGISLFVLGWRYELASGESYFRQGDLGRALKNYLAVEKHYADITEDQFDFHSYCLRKMTLRAYVDMLRFQDRLHSEPYFKKAAIGAIRWNLFVGPILFSFSSVCIVWSNKTSRHSCSPTKMHIFKIMQFLWMWTEWQGHDYQNMFI